MAQPFYRCRQHAVGLGLSCQDADIARYDGTLGEWYCDADIDTNTQLSEGQVETFVTNGSIGLEGQRFYRTGATDQNHLNPSRNLSPMVLSDCQRFYDGWF